MTDPGRPQLIAAMQAAGLIAAILAAAGPLSTEIIADRGRDATTPPSLATQGPAQPF